MHYTDKFKIFLYFITLLFFSIITNCSENISQNPISPSGWGKGVLVKGLIISINDNGKISRYWQCAGGSHEKECHIFKTDEDLTTFWKKFDNDTILQKPEIDFSKNYLITIEPGEVPLSYSFKIEVLNVNDTITFNCLPVKKRDLGKIPIGYYPIFAFEIPRTEKTILFNVDMSEIPHFFNIFLKSDRFLFIMASLGRGRRKNCYLKVKW